MRILTIDTSGAHGSVALCEDEKVLVQRSERTKAGHSTFLLPALSELLAETGWKINDLDRIVCVSGPGSFAGIRVGIASAKGLSFATGVPIVGVGSLKALAWGARDKEKILCPILDAKKKQVYTALFKSDGKGGLTRIMPDSSLTLDQLAESINQETLFFGEGAGKFAGWLEDRIGNQAFFGPEEMWYIEPSSIAALGRRIDLEAGESANLNPNYVRPPEAIEKAQNANGRDHGCSGGKTA
jgi:tRNA threonylcarbamoyladenosine biosynthesis protein TsaB